MEIRRTDDAQGALSIAKSLPQYFDAHALAEIEQESTTETLFGVYENERLIGFAIYKPLNARAIEMRWLGVLTEAQGKGAGTALVEESLKVLAQTYEVCEVKTLSAEDPYPPYVQTRAFYEARGFIPIETVNPYPGWGDNPCQIYVRFLR